MDDLDTVRLLADVNDTDWPDADVQALLDGEGGVVKLAAADLLDILAGRLLTVDSDEIKLDGSKQAATLQKRAAALREQHYAHGGDFYFDEARTGSVPRWVDGEIVLGWGDDAAEAVI